MTDITARVAICLADPSHRFSQSGSDIRKYDPNQPREPKGSPVGGQWRGYHGTDQAVEQQILAQGILSKPPRRNWPSDLFITRSRGRSVYMTDDLDVAFGYAGSAVTVRDQTRPSFLSSVVFEIEIPEEFADQIVRDELDDAAVRFEDNIPPEWIVGVHRPNKLGTSNYERLRKVGGRIIYAVVDLEAYAEEHGINKYDPNQPREPKGTPEGGRWTDGDISGRDKLVPMTEEVPEHTQKLRIPPAWTDVLINLDPDGDLLAVGRDAKGRLQYVYSEKFVESQMRAKFARIAELEDKHADIWDQLDFGDDLGLVTALIMDTGIRPGSTRDRGGDKQAFGATTLLGQHVTQDADGTVRLRFSGKHGIPVSVPINNTVLADIIMKRSQSAGSDGRLFSVTDRSLREYVGGLDGGSFTPKDFRTYVGTSTAQQLVASYEPPKTLTEYKRAVKQVAEQVSTQLGNTPTVALQSYIDPSVFSDWRVGVESGMAKRDVHFGIVGKDDFDWRKGPKVKDPDDEELKKTPADVIAVLGFDPKELESPRNAKK